jgi:hypothetical protein
VSTKSLDYWCKSALPENFSRVSGQTKAIQKFLREHLPEPMNQQVSVINCSDEEINIAVSDPQIANYLRLYVTEIQQQIHESLNMKQILKIRAMPDSLLKVGTRPQPSKPTRVAKETADAISKNANWIEDEDLRKSLLSLANLLKKD